MPRGATFLLKTEPTTFSFEKLVGDGTADWDGVSNAAALIHLRTIRSGDQILIYHTGDQKAIVGVARATSDPFPDPARPSLNERGEPKFAVFSLQPVRALKRSVTLAALKADARFAKFTLITQGRLSVMPVPPELADAILKLGG